MPAGCLWQAAQAHDRALAEELVESGWAPPTRAPRPTFAGWDDTRADLADVKDLLAQLMYLVARQDKPAPTVDRPTPAVEDVLDNRSSERLDAIVDTLLGN